MTYRSAILEPREDRDIREVRIFVPIRAHGENILVNYENCRHFR